MEIEEAVERFKLLFLKQLEDFKTNWKTRQKEEPNNFPSELNKEEWMKQFSAYLEMNNDDNALI